MADIENGCIWVGEQQTDYILTEWVATNLPTLYEQDTIRYEYNQFNQKWSQKSCTIFSAIWAISDLFNYEFDLKEIKEIDSLSYTLGRVANSWWYVQSAVKLVADYWNEHHADLWKVAYYRIDMADEDTVKAVIEKNYNICTWYYGNSAYTKDYATDAVLNGTEFGATTYGHAINVINYNWKRSVKDNYKWRTTYDQSKPCNIYELEHCTWEISWWHSFGYVYTKVSEDALEEVKRLNTLKTECNNCITQLWTIWHLVNDQNFKSILHYTADKLRGKINDCDEQLKKYE